MFAEIKSVLDRSHATLWQDALGMVALAVILVAGLHLPGLV